MHHSLDHIVIAVHDLDAAMLHYRARGFTVIYGGVHANRATQNALITFWDSTYLELLAPTGEAPIPDLIDFSALLPEHEIESPGGQVVGFALRSDDLDADAARLREAGFAVGEVLPGERRRADGTLVKWKLALLDGGFAPFLIEDVTPRHLRVPHDPALTTHANQVIGLRGIDIAVNDLTQSHARYSQLLGASPFPSLNSDRLFNLWGIKLHEAAPNQAPGPFAVHVVLEDKGTRNLNEVGQGNS